MKEGFTKWETAQNAIPPKKNFGRDLLLVMLLSLPSLFFSEEPAHLENADAAPSQIISGISNVYVADNAVLTVQTDTNKVPQEEATQKKSKTPVAKIWQSKEKKILPKKVEAPVSKWASNDPESTQSLYSSPLSKLSVSSNSFQYHFSIIHYYPYINKKFSSAKDKTPLSETLFNIIFSGGISGRAPPLL